MADEITAFPDRARWLSAGWLAAKLFGEDLIIEEAGHTSPQVAALGPIGHAYLNRKTSVQQRVAIARHLVSQLSVPLACVPLSQNQCLALTPEATFQLPEQGSLLFAEHPFLDEVVLDFVALCHHPDAGDIVLSGWNGKPQSISFVRQHGGHAGPGTRETHAFVLLPCDAPLTVRAGNFIRPVDLHDAARDFLKRHRTTRPAPGRGNQFQVMTYNVHACRGMDGKLSPRRIARVIAQSGADIVALQELDVGRSRTDHHDQAHAIARHLEMDFEFHPAWQLEEEQYGDAILSRFPMRLVKAGVLPGAKPKREKRGALWVEIELVEGRPLQVINTHLSLYPKEQLLQTRALLNDGWLDDAWPSGPLILMGDFNARPSATSYQLLARRLNDVESICQRDGPSRPSLTWPSVHPVVRIDHIFASIGDFEVRSSSSIRSMQASLASDHLPLVAQLALRAPSADARTNPGATDKTQRHVG